MSESQQPSTKIHQPKLKVCGLTQLDQIRELAALNIDFLGFIFYEKSPRYALNHLGLKQISSLNHHGKVGVFVNETAERILELSEKAQLNFIQLHGDEDENFITELRKRLNPEIGIIKVIRIKDQSSHELQRTINNQQKSISYFLFDTDSKAFGGTGKQFDWNILNKIEIPLPYFLSGGISSENIHQLSIISKKPFALDINSKFETEPGIKNLNQIRVFKENM